MQIRQLWGYRKECDCLSQILDTTCYCTNLTSSQVLGRVEAVYYRWPKRTFPSGGHSWQAAWKNSLLQWNSHFSLSMICLPFSFTHFLPSVSLSLSPLPQSLFPSLYLCPFVNYLSALLPLPLVPHSSLVVQVFFCFSPSHLSLSSLSIYRSQLPFAPPPCFAFFLSFSHLILYFFFTTARYMFALPPSFTRSRTHTCTDAHISFSLSVYLIWISTKPAVLARCLPSSGNISEQREKRSNA